MIKFLATTILGLSIVGGGAISVPVQQIDVKNQNEIHIQTQTENLTNIQWHNNQYSLSNDEASLNLFDKYSIDIDEAKKASDIYIQEEYIPFEEVVPVEYIEANSDIALMNIGTSYEQQFIHNDGYIKFTTKAYAIGFYDGNIVYHVEVTTEQLKSFIINKNDNLIIRHGNNSDTFNHQNYPVKGLRTIPCTIYYPMRDPIKADEREELSPNYSSTNDGVYYTFKAGSQGVADSTVTVSYGYTKVTGDYYLVATDSTAVQPIYVHNQDWFVDSLSLSFGPIGVGVSTGINLSDVMEGAPMTLKGYAGRTEQNVYAMNPADWNFDARYYFLNEGLKYTTKTFDDFIISTERLRCGYIEEQYINLSPNRVGAGDAYLELTFNKPVYELNTYLSFWSAGEGLFSIDGDYVYIQYLDANGNWKTYVDLLASRLPTDRTAQKYFECEFVEGTYGIRFVAHKENPNKTRNKGRICIGETKFITCDIK